MFMLDSVLQLLATMKSEHYWLPETEKHLCFRSNFFCVLWKGLPSKSDTKALFPSFTHSVIIY